MDGGIAMAEIVGRDDELRAISSFIEESGPKALLIEGEAGIGKTTLWRAGVEAARDLSYVVLSPSPAEKEATFAYSVAGDLLEHVLDDALAELPGPQRRALGVALLGKESDGPPPEQHTLGVALLGVLRALAASRLLGMTTSSGSIRRQPSCWSSPPGGFERSG
jgi:hypothetical protein